MGKDRICHYCCAVGHEIEIYRDRNSSHELIDGSTLISWDKADILGVGHLVVSWSIKLLDVYRPCDCTDAFMYQITILMARDSLIHEVPLGMIWNQPFAN